MIGTRHRVVRADYNRLEKRIGYRFKDRALLRQALTTRFADERVNYERLEYFGDGVLRHLLPFIIDARYPKLAPGELSRRYSLLSRNTNLAFLATRLKLMPYIDFGRRHPVFEIKLLADVVEAIFGAIHQDGGIEAPMPVCRRLFRLDLELVRFDRPDEVLLTGLAEQRQRPTYIVHPKLWGRSHIAGYVVELKVGNQLVVPNGEGVTQDMATNRAAAIALLKLFPSRYPSDIRHFSWRFGRR